MTQRCDLLDRQGSIAALRQSASDKRPTEFKTKAKDGFLLVTLKRVESKQANDSRAPATREPYTPTHRGPDCRRFSASSAPTNPGPTTPPSTGSRAEKDTTARYRSSPGDEITHIYRRPSPTKALQGRLEDLGAGPGCRGAWRLVIRCDLSATRKVFGGKPRQAPSSTRSSGDAGYSRMADLWAPPPGGRCATRSDSSLGCPTAPTTSRTAGERRDRGRAGPHPLAG